MDGALWPVRHGGTGGGVRHHRSFSAARGVPGGPGEARGLGEALRALRGHAYGPWLLGGVAFGLVAYGLYQCVAARYCRIHPA